MYSVIAYGYAGLKKYDIALIYANKYINAEKEIDGYSARGDIYFQMGSYQNALDDYNKFAEATVMETEIYGGYIYKKIGETLLNLGQKKEACESFQKAIDFSVDIDSDLLNQCKE